MTSTEIAIQAEDERAEVAEVAREDDFATLEQIVKTWGIEGVAHELQAIASRLSNGRTKLTYGLKDLEAFAFGYDDNSHLVQYDEF